MFRKNRQYMVLVVVDGILRECRDYMNGDGFAAAASPYACVFIKDPEYHAHFLVPSGSHVHETHAEVDFIKELESRIRVATPEEAEVHIKMELLKN